MFIYFMSKKVLFNYIMVSNVGPRNSCLINWNYHAIQKVKN